MRNHFALRRPLRSLLAWDGWNISSTRSRSMSVLSAKRRRSGPILAFSLKLKGLEIPAVTGNVPNSGKEDKKKKKK